MSANENCPFCNVAAMAKQTVYLSRFWRAVNNIRPYNGTRTHVMLVPVAHVTNIADITPDMWADFGFIFQHTQEEFAFEGGGLLMRFGDPRLHGGSVPHLHAHIIVPDGTVPVKTIFYQERT